MYYQWERMIPLPHKVPSSVVLSNGVLLKKSKPKFMSSLKEFWNSVKSIKSWSSKKKWKHPHKTIPPKFFMQLSNHSNQHALIKMPKKYFLSLASIFPKPSPGNSSKIGSEVLKFFATNLGIFEFQKTIWEWQYKKEEHHGSVAIIL